MSPFPRVDEWRELVAADIQGVAQPLWAPDGQELFYRDGTHMMAVSVSVDGRDIVSVGIPVPLFDDVYETPTVGRDYDLGPDGRFLMIKDAGNRVSRAPRQINIVRNWVETLAEQVPVP